MDPPVTSADLECRLAEVRAAAAGPVEGVFGPRSVTWAIDREAAVFLGAGRAMLLQLAHPWVAAAIATRSRTLEDPIGRFHRTFDVVFSMVFGTLGRAQAMARGLHRLHASVEGVLPAATGPFPAGSPYRANDPAALRWVQATLADTSVLVHERVSGPLPSADLDAFHRESRLFAALFGIPAGMLGPDWAASRAYVDAMCGSDTLTVTPEARRLARALLAGAGSRLAAPGWYRALTAHLLPGRLRRDFGLDYGPAEIRAAERALAAARLLRPRLPARLRFVGPYQEALARLEGRPGPDMPTRLLNRFWIGRPRLGPEEEWRREGR